MKYFNKKLEGIMMNAKKNKQGFKFFWVYLLLGSFSAFGNFTSFIKQATVNNNSASILLNAYAAFVCALFIIATIMFILSTLFIWKHVYRIAYYIHAFFLGLCIIERMINMITSCYVGNFFVIPINIGYIFLFVLIFLYFRKRKELQKAILKISKNKNAVFQQSHDKISDQNQAFFSYTCSKRGKKLKIKYNLTKNPSPRLQLSIVCPYCKEKATVTPPSEQSHNCNGV
jgi:hypothetical protein